jgi:DNA (cytosine-5)-methyltransferase 1
VELICQHSPDFFLFENVKGLWRTKRHKAFFDELKTKLRSHGYVLTEKLVNTLRFGVPQERERIILIGVKANPERQDVLNSMISDFPWWRYAPYSASDLERIQWPETDPFITGPRAMPPKIQQRLTVEHWFNKNDVVNHPNAQHRFQPRAGLARFLTVEEGDDSKKSYKRLHRWRYSPTACYGNNEVHLHPYEARRISVAEALAIQSLPRAYCLPPTMTLSDMFKTVGNGVPYVAAKALASALRDFLEEFHGKTNGVGSGSVHRGASKRQTLQLPEPRKPRDDIYSVDQGA